MLVCHDSEQAAMQVRAKIGDKPQKGQTFFFPERTISLCGGKKAAGMRDDMLRASVSFHQDSPNYEPTRMWRACVEHGVLRLGQCGDEGGKRGPLFRASQKGISCFCMLARGPPLPAKFFTKLQNCERSLRKLRMTFVNRVGGKFLIELT